MKKMPPCAHCGDPAELVRHDDFPPDFKQDPTKTYVYKPTGKYCCRECYLELAKGIISTQSISLVET